MADTLTQLKNDLLALPMETRASLAHTLIQSLDDEVDVDVDTLWEKEIKRRDAQIRAGKAVTKPAEQVIRDIQQLLISMN